MDEDQVGFEDFSTYNPPLITEDPTELRAGYK
jgi:hypothetical protein